MISSILWFTRSGGVVSPTRGSATEGDGGLTTTGMDATGTDTARIGAATRLGERLRSLRLAAGLTQTELAGERCSKEYVSQIHAYQHIELRALEKGYLQDTFVDEGQVVEQ